MKKGKNDEAWEKLFDKYDILSEIDRNETFSIRSKQINEFREARLMTKFDHSNQLPEIFSKNNITILPDSRGNYILGKFKMFEELKHKNLKPISMKIPDFIQSLDITKITSESSALNIAHMSQMIDSVMRTKHNEPQSLLTLSGRMSSGSLQYNILNVNKKIHEFSVENAQIEIDGSYENLNKILIVEAKNKIPLDFNIRQLYYPFRLYQNLNTTKDITPVFFTYADDIFSFHVYKFTDTMNYSSIKKVEQINFILDDSLDLNLEEVKQISATVKEVEEPKNVPFPQADTFTRILDMIDYIYERKNKYELAEAYDFDLRQSDYYANALVYLGLATKQDYYFKLNNEGIKIKNMHNSNKRNALIISKILSHKPFKLAFDSTLKNGGEYDRKYISKVLLDNVKSINSISTANRRMQTVIAWINWIFSVIE
ncbi:type II restriction enzyme [Enterococcus faecalis]|uniref:type II restriction enzyme n=1 Tax=Enterococcus faecalis TaxID=1351 RepID=UPI0030091DBD